MKSALKLATHQFIKDLRAATGFTCCWFACYGRSVVLSLALVITLGLAFLLPADNALLHLVQTDQPQVIQAAKQVSFFGDFAGFNLVLFVGMMSWGWVGRSRLLQRLAVASLCCTIFSGLSANAVRFVTGRPRPSTHTIDMLHGPSFSSDYHALPSAHSATAFGAALPVVMSAPLIGAPLTLVATAVGWSRLQLNRHHPTDVLASVLIAFLFSIPLSRWALGWPSPSRSMSHFKLLSLNAVDPASLSH